MQFTQKLCILPSFTPLSTSGHILKPRIYRTFHSLCEMASGMRVCFSYRFSRWIHPSGSPCRKQNHQLPETMLHWTLVFLVVAIIAAILGFGVVAGTAAYIAKILFLVFLIIWIVSLISRKN